MLPTQTNFITRNQFQNENSRQLIKTFFRHFLKKITSCDYKIHIHFFSPGTGKKSIKKNEQDKTQSFLL